MNNMNMEQKYASDLLKMIFSPLLLCLGLIGNIISIVIFREKSMRKHTTFRYLTLLSIVDLCSLYIGCTQIMFDVYFDIDFRLLNELSCRIQSFLVYFFTHFSSMLLACMSIDRTVAITSKNKKLSTPKTALKIFFILSTLICLIDCHFLLFTHLYEIAVNDDQNMLFYNQSYFFKSNSTLDMHEANFIEYELNVTNNLNTKICYAHLNTIYYYYLVSLFPW